MPFCLFLWPVQDKTAVFFSIKCAFSLTEFLDMNYSSLMILLNFRFVEQV